MSSLTRRSLLRAAAGSSLLLRPFWNEALAQGEGHDLLAVEIGERIGKREQPVALALRDRGKRRVESIVGPNLEMLGGEPPFTGPTAQAIISKRLLSTAPRLTTIRDVPAEIEKIVSRLLAP